MKTGRNSKEDNIKRPLNPAWIVQDEPFFGFSNVKVDPVQKVIDASSFFSCRTARTRLFSSERGGFHGRNSGGLVVHVWNRGNNRADVFHDPDDRQAFLVPRRSFRVAIPAIFTATA